MIKRAGAGVAQNQGMTDAVVKLRGLPFGCSKEEIAQFFTGSKPVFAFLCAFFFLSHIYFNMLMFYYSLDIHYL